MLTLRLRRAGKSRWPANLQSQISNLKSLAESCSRQSRGCYELFGRLFCD
jgi:hypothetical protein